MQLNWPVSRGRAVKTHDYAKVMNEIFTCEKVERVWASWGQKNACKQGWEYTIMQAPSDKEELVAFLREKGFRPTFPVGEDGYHEDYFKQYTPEDDAGLTVRFNKDDNTVLLYQQCL